MPLLYIFSAGRFRDRPPLPFICRRIYGAPCVRNTERWERRIRPGGHRNPDRPRASYRRGTRPTSISPASRQCRRIDRSGGPHSPPVLPSSSTPTPTTSSSGPYPIGSPSSTTGAETTAPGRASPVARAKRARARRRHQRHPSRRSTRLPSRWPPRRPRRWCSRSTGPG